MADLAILTLPGTVMPMFQHEPGTVVKAKIAGVTPINSGIVVYEDTTSGKVKVADATIAGAPSKPSGIVVGEAKNNGQSVTVLQQGPAVGFDLSNNNPGDAIYLDIAGGISSTPNGVRAIQVGVVRSTAQIDPNTSKLKLYIDFFFNPGNDPLTAVGVKKVAKVAVANLQNGALSWANPESTPVVVNKVTLDTTVVATGACSVQVGTTVTSATTGSNNLIDTLNVNAAIGTFDNVSNPGANGKALQKLAAGGWVTIAQISGNATGLVGNLYIEYFNVY